VILVLSTAACCGTPERASSYTPISDGPLLDDATPLAIFVNPDRVWIKRAATAKIMVYVTAGTSPATLSVSGLPPGVTADPATIQAGDVVQAIVLHASTTAVLDPEVPFVVEAITESGQHATGDGMLTVLERAGAPDLELGGTGFVTLDVDGDPTTTETPVGLGVDDEGFALVAGRIDDSDPGTPPRSFVLMIRPEGTVEPGWSSPGILPIGVEATTATVWTTSRKWTQVDSSGDFVIRDLQSIHDIQLDIGGVDAAAALLIYSSITVAGTSTTSGVTHVAVARLGLDGAPVSTFGVGGVMQFDYPLPVDRVVDVARAVNDVVLAQLGDSVGVASIANTGQLDPLFAGTGVVVVGSAGAPLLAIGVDKIAGDVLVACASGPSRTLALYLFDIQGNPEPTFSSGGVLEDPDLVDAGDAIYRDHGILATGARSTSATSSELALTRYTFMGEDDTTFGDAGTTTLAIGQQARGVRLAVQFDGRITVAGTSDGKLALARFWP
jgi:hypothetical protein